MSILKALTICQPYAHLICVTGEKLVENRTWWTSHRGLLVIHAGKSRDWLSTDQEFDPDPQGMAFGAIVGVANLIDCVKLDNPASHRKYPWLQYHTHAEGPYCWVLADRQRLITPLPWKGAQGLWPMPLDFAFQPDQLVPTPPAVLGIDLRVPGPNPTRGVQ